MMAVFFFIAHEKGFKFHAQPQIGAYNIYSCFFLESIFFSSMSASIKKKVSQNRTKLQQNKQTNDHFSAKNKLSISKPNFTKFEGKVRFGQFF